MGTVIVVAEKFNHELYNLFSLEGESVKISPLNGAIDFVKQNTSDLIIFDSSFDVENGLKLLKDIKDLLPGTPVIFLADNDAEDVVLRAFKTGARDFFKKPINLDELRETVKGILSVKRGTRESRQRFRQTVSPDEEFYRILTTDLPVSIIRAIRYIEENLSSSINLENLAQEANMSKYHFSRLFKKHLGISPKKFVVSQKIKKAKKLLTIPNCNVSTVSSDIGFNDLSSFITQFKKLTGITPYQYKKRYKD